MIIHGNGPWQSFPGNNFHVPSFLSHYQSEIFATLVTRPHDYSWEWSTHPFPWQQFSCSEFPQPLSEQDLCYLGDKTSWLFMGMVHSPSFPGNNFHVLSFLSHYQSKIFATLVTRPHDYSREWSTHPFPWQQFSCSEFPQPLSERDLCYLGDKTSWLFMGMVHSPSFPGKNLNVGVSSATIRVRSFKLCRDASLTHFQGYGGVGFFLMRVVFSERVLFQCTFCIVVT